MSRNGYYSPYFSSKLSQTRFNNEFLNMGMVPGSQTNSPPNEKVSKKMRIEIKRVFLN